MLRNGLTWPEDSLLLSSRTRRGRYNRTGETAHLPGDHLLARAMMTRLGYTPAQIEVAGPDAPNFQGVRRRVAGTLLRCFEKRVG